MLTNSTFDARLNPHPRFQQTSLPSRYEHIASGCMSEIGDALTHKMGVA